CGSGRDMMGPAPSNFIHAPHQTVNPTVPVQECGLPMTVSTPLPCTDRPALIELDRATVVRGQVRVLDGFSLRIGQGEHTAILGPNGCGKSTLIKLVTRELYPLARAGEAPPVRVLGRARWQVDRLRSQLGIVTGDFGATLAGLDGLSAE